MEPIRREKGRRRLGLRLLAGLGALVVLACGTAFASDSNPNRALSAQAGSIVFRKAGNIWVARPDGSGQRRVTREGTAAEPYEYPAQADNGTIFTQRGAEYGTFLYRMSRNGRVLGKPVKVSVGLRNKGVLHTLAFGTTVSNDGKRVALSRALLEGIYSPAIGIGGLKLLSQSIDYYNAISGAPLRTRNVPGAFLAHPSWIDNRRVLVFKPQLYVDQVFVDTLGGGKLKSWFGQEDGKAYLQLNDGELTRAGDKLALIRGSNTASESRQTTIHIYSVKGFTTAPEVICVIRPPGQAQFANPTWSPDGTALAWSDARSGIWSARVSAGGPDCGARPKLIVRGGSVPDWGPAKP